MRSYFSNGTTFLLVSAFALTCALPVNAATSDPTLRERSSEAVVSRGGPQNISSTEITVYIPGDATDLQIKAYMKNEIWGGKHVPPKADTDDLGSIDYKECHMGSGDCPIAFSAVGPARTESMPTGMTKVSATFSNWAGRNDRTGKLVVSFHVPK